MQYVTSIVLCKTDCKQAKNKPVIMSSSHFPCPKTFSVITITGVGLLNKDTSVRNLCTYAISFATLVDFSSFPVYSFGLNWRWTSFQVV